MSPHDEFNLYQSNRAAWAEYVAPRWAAMLKAADAERKRELWRIACPQLRAALTALKDSTGEDRWQA